jgi:acetyl esterase/lipase
MNRVSRALVFVTALLVCTSVAPAQHAGKSGKMPPAPSVPEGVKAHRDLAYVEGGHERQRLDLFVPQNATQPLPLILWIHGGAWSAGDKGGCPPLRAGYAQRGFAVASMNYRLSQHAIFPAQIEDCKAAIRWLRTHAKDYNLNPERIGVWGSSAGGHLVTLVGTSGDVKEFDVGAHLDVSSRVRCVMDDYGPTLFTQMDSHRVSTAAMVHDLPTSPESKLIGGLISDPANAAKIARVNPITYVTKDDPPFLIVHGDEDPLVPHHQSELLFDALKAAGVRVRLNTVKGGGHGTGFGGPELEKIRRDFFEHHLQGAANDAAKSLPAMRSSTEAITTSGNPAKQKTKTAKSN